MPDVECIICKRRIYAPEGGKCAECSKPVDEREAMGPREYLVERAISSVRSIKGMGRMAAMLEYSCMLLEARGIESPFALTDGQINRSELHGILKRLEQSGHIKTEHPDWPAGSKEFLLIEKYFTMDESQIDSKIVFLVRVLNCHSEKNIRLLARCTPSKLGGQMADSSVMIKKLLSGPYKESMGWFGPSDEPPRWYSSRGKPPGQSSLHKVSMEWFSSGEKLPKWSFTRPGVSLYLKNEDDTHARRVFWKSRGKEMPPPAPPETLYKMRGILKTSPVLAKYDFVKLYNEERLDTGLF